MLRHALVVIISATAISAWGCESMCAEDERLVDGICRHEPKECGALPPHPECHFGDDECWAHGGRLRCSYLDPDTCWCECPSGDEGCPCWDQAHCQGACVVDPYPSGCSADNEHLIGVCAPTTSWFRLGCWCHLDDGVPVPYCFD